MFTVWFKNRNQQPKYKIIFLAGLLYRNTTIYFSAIQNNLLKNILQTFQITATLSLTYT